MELRVADPRTAPDGVIMLENPDMQDAFWVSFFAGLTAPTNLYAPPAPYFSYVVPIGPSESFAIAGAYLGNTLALIPDDREDEREEEAA